MKKEITTNNNSTYALRFQSKLGPYDFPFTLNPTIGCFYTCKYCFSPIVLWKERKEFFNKVEIKVNVPELLKKQLGKLSWLPQHLKRVQINEANDLYHPLVLNYMRDELKRDIMLEILDTFNDADKSGNHWMLHILTKSNLVTTHFDTLANMNHMVQVEMSFSSADEEQSRKVELYTPTVEKRLEAISALAQRNIFVRVMAMPFKGSLEEVIAFREKTIKYGAKAFKHKELNYFNWADVENISEKSLFNDELLRTGSKKDRHFDDVILKSGEIYYENDKPVFVDIQWPIFKNSNGKSQDWTVRLKDIERLNNLNVQMINCGYTDISGIDWNYIK